MMKPNYLILFVVSILTIAVEVSAQTSGVRSEYMKDGKTTRVETNMLFVHNEPDQFVEVMFRGWFKGEKLTAPVKQMELDIYSFSKRPLFASQSVYIIADGIETKVGTPNTQVLKGQTNNGVDTFFVAGGNPNVGIQVPVPSTAQIKSGGNLNGKTLEWMAVGMKPDPFLKLLTASKIEIRVGNATFLLTDRHVEIVHNFVQQLTLP